MAIRIGELARSTRTNPPTIRYYEDIGLLPPPERHRGGQRLYREEDRRRLTFIRQCREFGFPIEQVRSLVALTEDSERPCVEARDIAHEHLGVVRDKLTELRRLEQALAEFIRRCDTTCAGGPGGECVILRDLSVPASDARPKGPRRRAR